MYKFYTNSPCYKQLIDNTESRPYPRWRNRNMFIDKLTKVKRKVPKKDNKDEYEF